MARATELFRWLGRRVAEPSTWAGLSAVLTAVATATNLEDLEAAADTTRAVGEAIGAGDWALVAGAVASGIVAIVRRERGKRT